jgi:RimJ/RimL family protein N-acetyltransferase
MREIDITVMTLQDILSVLRETSSDEERNLATAHTRLGNGPALTFSHEGHVIACSGATIYWPGVAEVWLVPSRCWRLYAKEAVILTRSALRIFQEKFSLRRLQADVVASDATARRFVKHYGFVKEGLMRAYDVLGRDCVRYARVRSA